ncbi:MAG: hypothetical protein KDC54_21020, partial [Lewinella sp.]|nr:hypothetical protein [Lewinella sp.]
WTDLSGNNAINGVRGPDYTEYPAELGVNDGFIFPNYRTSVGELALEGVLQFNRLRERTGLHLAIFGGLGLDGYRARMDQEGDNGMPYYDAYAALLGDSRQDVRRSLREDILDGTYETAADGYENGFEVGFMPSLGFEVGYQLTPRFSLVAGHRITFSGTDELEGFAQVGSSNDVYHYTNLGLRWTLDPGRSRGLPPEIMVEQPSYSPYEVHDLPYAIRARILRVNSAADVTCTLNGRNLPFDFSGESFRVILQDLRPGDNTLLITATNRDGRDQEQLILRWGPTAPPPPPPPVASGDPPYLLFTRPARDPFQTVESRYELRATVQHITRADQLQLRVNGREQAFQFSSATESLTAELYLQEGTNTIVLYARNTYGQDEISTRIIRQLNYTSEPPQVRITYPGSGERTTASRIPLEATIDGVEERQQLRVTVRGTPTTNYQFDARTGRLTAEVSLLEGANTLSITATNQAGSDSDAVTVYRGQVAPPPPPPPTQPPVDLRPSVQILQPANNATSPTEAADFRAAVQQVERSSELTLMVNGRRVTNFTFDYRRQEVTARLRLDEGENTIRLEARTRGGRDEDQVRVRYQPLRRPVVRIDVPTAGEVFSNPDITLRATIGEVERQSDLVVLLNRQRVNNFSFDGRQLRASLRLQEGSNTIEVIARTAAGQDEDEVSVTYRRVSPPTVQIQSPADGATFEHPNIALRATITEVEQASGITLRLNGRSITGFSFDGRNLRADLELQPRNNTIEVIARNEAGQDSRQVRVTYLPLQAPTVAIQSPADGAVFRQANITLRATIDAVEQASGITLRLNGRSITNFSFDGRNLRADLQLQPRSNTIEVTARNEAGQDSKQIRVTYTPPQPPTVAIQTPEDGSTTTNTRATLLATTTGIERAAQVVVLLNGRSVRDVRLAAGEVRATLSLREGTNTIKVRVTNDDGQAEDQVELTYRQPAPNVLPPTVRFERPSRASTTVNVVQQDFRVRTTQISDRTGLTIRHNGQEISDYTFGREEDILTFSLAMTEGTNTISVAVANTAGSAEAEVQVNYEAVNPNRPRITIESISRPAQNPMSPGIGSSTVKASLINVNRPDQIELTVNGRAITDFSYSNRTGLLTAQVQLTAGENVIVIKATTPNGQAQVTETLNF